MICFYYTVKIEVGLILVCCCCCCTVCAFSFSAPCWFFSIRSFSRSFVSMHHFMVSFIVTPDCLHTQRFEIIPLLKWITLMEFYHFCFDFFLHLLSTIVSNDKYDEKSVFYLLSGFHWIKKEKWEKWLNPWFASIKIV